MKNLEMSLFRAAAAWTGIGLVGGLAYRELTRSQGFTGFTELAVVHTHALVLGSVFLLLVLVLQRVFALAGDARMTWFHWTWNAGLALTVAGLAVKGTLQVLGSSAADSPVLAGVAGLGHILLTIGFVVFFVVLGSRLRTREEVRPLEASEAAR